MLLVYYACSIELIGLLWLVSGLWSMNLEVGPQREALARLYDDLAKHRIFRNPMGPLPVKDVNLTILIWLQTVLNVKEATQTVETGIALSMLWDDPDVHWNPADYSDIDRIAVPRSRIWYPVLRFTNAAERENQYVEGFEDVNLTANGSLLYHTWTIAKTLCNFDLTFFPFDSQTCKIVIVSNSAHALGANTSVVFMDPLLDDFVVEYFQVTSEWTIESPFARMIQDQSAAILYVEIGMTIRRASVFYVYGVLLPMLVTSLLTTFVFLIPAESGEKISFLVSIYVSTAFFFSFAVDTLPRKTAHGVDAPRMMKFLTFVIAENVLALAATIFVMRRHHEVLATEKANIDKVMTPVEDVTVPSISDNETTVDVSRSKIFQFLKDKIDKMVSSLQKCKEARNLKGQSRVPKSAAALDRIFFILFFVVCVPFNILVFVI